MAWGQVFGALHGFLVLFARLMGLPHAAATAMFERMQREAVPPPTHSISPPTHPRAAHCTARLTAGRASLGPWGQRARLVRSGPCVRIFALCCTSILSV